MELHTIAVVGASLSGLRAVETLRREGFDGRLVLVGAEPELPYDRPPLSKDFLAGESEPEQLALRKLDYDDLDLDVRLATRADAVDLGARTLALDSGESLAFDGLVIATGSSPRTLPGTPDLPGIFVLRTLADAVAIRAALEHRPKVVVVGAGFIGSEVAATCRRARPRRHRARSAPRAARAWARSRARHGVRRAAPRPRRRPAPRRRCRGVRGSRPGRAGATGRRHRGRCRRGRGRRRRRARH